MRDRDRLVLVLAYSLSWGAILVNRGLYWDDWTLVGRSPASLMAGYGELGMPWIGYFQAALFSLPLPALVGHVIVFGAYLLSTLILHDVLRRTPGLSRMDALVAALVFAVLPVNYARIALINLPYGLSLLAFLAATWLLVRYLEDGGRVRRVASLALYLGSFTTASLLVLYVVPMALAAVIVQRSARRSLRSFVPRHAEFLALPVAFWLVKAILFTPSGAYQGYNALTARGLAGVPQAMLSVPGQVLVEPLYRAATVAGIVGVVVGVGVAAWLVRRSRVVEPGTVMAAPVLALVGVATLGLGIFAYLAVGRTPEIWDWSSRHQLLVPLGAGLMAAAAIRGAKVARRAGPVFAVALALLVGISIVADARTLVAYQVDWFKQLALIDAVRSIPAMQTARHIRVVDSATAFNTLDRTYRFYEYNALFSEAIGGTGRLASDPSNEPSPARLDLFVSRPAYHMGEYVPAPVDLELRVSAAAGLPDGFEVLRLVVLEILGSPSFEPEVSGLIDVTAVPVAAAGPVP